MTHHDAPSSDDIGFSAFGLADSILTAVKREGFTNPTQIQTKAIPSLMEGNDLMGIAQTGGGKTAAFALPMINKLLEDYQRPRANMPKVLILAPTRELAQQIELCIKTFSKGSKLSSLVVAGGQPYPPQTNNLRRGIDILVATPGRLIDHINRKNVKFDEIRTFILDEADRMLDMGFIDDVSDIAASLPEDHQTIFFSATMNQKVRNLSKTLLTDPVYVEIYKKTAVADTITHKLMNVTRKNKAELLSQILSGEGVEKALVFARTKIGADDLCDLLYEKGIKADAIHGDKRQRVREKILMNFRRGRTNVLVATDVAARGIDVDGISHVINYELPIEPENYVHRVGRTGRAGATGIAISFCDPSDVRLLKNIEQLIKIPIDVDADHEFHIEVTSRGRGNAGGGRGRFSEGSGRGRHSEGRGGRESRGFRDDRRPSKFSHDDSAPSSFTRKERGPSIIRDGGSSIPREDRASSKFSRDDRPRSDRPASRDNPRTSRDFSDKPRVANDDWNSEGRSSRRVAPSRPSRPARQQDKPVRKEATRYDPWAGAKEFSDDPVLGKLLGKSPVFESKKNDKADFVKPTFKGKKPFKKAEADEKSFASKKARGGKKTLTTAKDGKPGNKSTKIYKPKGKGAAKAAGKPVAKDIGGTKAFAPKRKTLKPSRAA